MKMEHPTPGRGDGDVMLKKRYVFQSQILVLAIFISLAWHLFWLSAIKVVVAPPDKRPIRFSKVSFLGPLLTRSAAEIGIAPKALTFPEKRYLAKIRETAGQDRRARQAIYAQDYESDIIIPKAIDEKLISFIDESLGGQKLEPVSLKE